MYKVAKEKSKLIDFTQVFDLMAVTARESIRNVYRGWIDSSGGWETNIPRLMNSLNKKSE